MAFVITEAKSVCRANANIKMAKVSFWGSYLWCWWFKGACKTCCDCGLRPFIYGIQRTYLRAWLPARLSTRNPPFLYYYNISQRPKPLSLFLTHRSLTHVGFTSGLSNPPSWGVAHRPLKSILCLTNAALPSFSGLSFPSCLSSPRLLAKTNPGPCLIVSS